ncbi:MAG: hypothetical protein ACRDJW_03465 [Thermomicrobiales bacterium]
MTMQLDELVRGEDVEWTPAMKEQLSREADEMFRRGELPDPDVLPYALLDDRSTEAGSSPRSQ